MVPLGSRFQGAASLGVALPGLAHTLLSLPFGTGSQLLPKLF